jgi:hypothetical protein
MSTRASPAEPARASAPAAAAPLVLCPGDRPLVLLPVRLETRFFTLPGNLSELRVRVYPDKIHLDTHEPELLPTEHEWGAHYWAQDWRAGNDAAARATAWRQLADRFGAERAAWIVRSLQPVNPQQRAATPTPAGQPLPVAPVLPAPSVVADGRDAAWRHAPQARLLPERWLAILRSGTGSVATQVTGRDIARPLAAGPDPDAPEVTLGDEQLAIDPGMKWMVDFDEAEAKGMALRIPLPPATLGGAADSLSLLVFGVAASAGSSGAAQQLAQLLDAHHYTDGLAFVRQGTPTNNSEERRAAATADDAAHQHSFAVEVASDPAALDARSNAVRLGTALGLPTATTAAVLGRVADAGASHEADLRSMNLALWQVGWGYYLSNMVGFDGTGLTQSTLAWAREHFASHVRSGGPFPVLRCGRQPYGVLPVTSLDLWQPRAGEEQALAPDLWLRGLLVQLRDNVWRARLGEAFRIGRRSAPPDPDADLADVMRTDALSSGYRTRSVFGRHYLQHLRAFMGEDLQATGFLATDDALAAGVLQRMGLAWRPRLARAVAADTTWQVSAPLVQAGEVSPWRKLEPNYIATLLATPRIDELLAARPDPSAPDAGTSLLQVLLRHALLRELADAAALIAAGAPGADAAALRRDAELVDLVTGAAPTPTWKRQLDLSVADVTGNGTIRQFLETLTTFSLKAVPALGEFRSALGHLQGLDSETLQYLMQGTLDLSSHRLDAWITSFASKRLASMTAAGAPGVYVGGYGWVENLRPAPPSAWAPVTALPAGEPGPLFTRVNDSGFIHAPSLTHAAAAALLRNAHLGASGVPTPDSPFAVDLSSRRVREAERLLDGVRQGQRLGALLGYRFERSLHELGFDVFILPLRQLAPLAASLSASSAVQEAVAANNVVDGLELSRQWQRDPEPVRQVLRPLLTGTSTLSQLEGELDALGEAIDGLGDALTAEAAYQMARGNTSRVSSTLAAVAQGDAPPPELEVARTPRSGTALTHRLMLLFSGSTGATPGWLPWNSGIRSAMEPMLNYWASKMLGDASKVRCSVERIDAVSGAVAETRTLPLSELAITPLDVVYGVQADTSAAQSPGTLCEIEQWVLYQARHRPGGFDAQAPLRLQHARPADLAAGELSLFDVLEQARALRRLLASARGADPEDLNPPERLAAGVVDLVELEARVVRGENALNAAHKGLALWAAKGATPTAEALRTGLMKLGAFGVAPAAPCVASGENPNAVASLLAQTHALLKDSAARLARGAALRALAAPTDLRARREHLVQRMQAAFGASFVVMPRFNCGAAASTELTSALAASQQTLGGDALAANGWLARCARVREAAARMSHCLRGAEVLGTGERLNLSVAQLPLVAGERWVALTPEAGQAVPAGKLSLVCQTIATINTAQPLSGLLVDEWIESVPSASETTALTFQFDPPDAAPPQSLLIAVPPVPGADWTSDTLRQVLDETFNLARLRALDTESLGEVAQYLPALYMAFNAKDDAVSTDFVPLTR